MVQLAELQMIEDILVTGKKPRGIVSFEKLEAKKKTIERSLEVRVLRYYNRIRERYNDAVVPLQEGHCSGCGMEITPLMQQEVRRGIGINYCGGCGRILTWKPDNHTAKKN
jgi:predicted  nucleic acid-binding Zn-ribbon protein